MILHINNSKKLFIYLFVYLFIYLFINTRNTCLNKYWQTLKIN